MEVAKERSMASGTGGGHRARRGPRGTKKAPVVYGGPDMYPLARCPGWFTNATPPHLQSDVDQYVIRWDVEPKSYFKQLAVPGLPAFGASLAETPRFASPEEAQQTIDRFPVVAQVGCEVETVRGRLGRALRD
jgi:hypothetical protein